MSSAENRLRKNFFVATVLHATLIGGILFFEGCGPSVSMSVPTFVELITPADILGELPKGPGQGRGAYTPPQEPMQAHGSFGSSETVFTPEERPAPQPKAVPQPSTDPNDILIPKKPVAKDPKKTDPVATKSPTTAQKSTKPAAKPPATTKPLANKGTVKADSKATTGKTGDSADAIRQRFAKALQSSGGPGGTPYGDGRTAGGGTGTSGRIGSPDGSPDGIVGGVGKGSPFWSYYLQVHDRMYEAWEQPGQVESLSRKLVSEILIRVMRDGRIVSVTLKNSSGNRLMDDSAVAAARSVLQLDPLPEGLGDAHADILVNFRLEG